MRYKNLLDTYLLEIISLSILMSYNSNPQGIISILAKVKLT